MGKLTMLLGWGVVALFLCLPVSAAPTQADVDRLVDKMANGKFKEREAAFKELEKIGQAALPALENAAKSEDPDLAQRAQDLIKAIHKKADADAILKPTMVTLNYKDETVEAILQDLTKKTGYSVVAISGQQKKVTIETKEITLWEAIDQLCEKAGLVHQTPATGMGTGGGPGVPQPDIDLPQRDVARPIRPRPQPGFNPNQIILAEGKYQSLPTTYLGAIRVRAIPSEKFQQGTPLEKDEALMAFEVIGEPKIMVIQLTVRLEKAVDEKDQKIEPMAMIPLENGADDGTVVINGNVAIVRGGARNMKLRIAPGPIGPSFGPCIATAKVKLPENGGKAVKQLQGTLILQVQGRDSITIDDPANAKGKTFKSKAGREVKVLEVKKNDNGQLELQVESEFDPNQGGGIMPFPGGRPGGPIRIQPALPQIQPLPIQNFQMNAAPAQAFACMAEDLPADAVPPQKAVPPQQAQQIEIEVQPLPIGKPAPPIGPDGRPYPGGYYGGEQYEAFDKDGKPCSVGVQLVKQEVVKGKEKFINVFKVTIQPQAKGEVAKVVLSSPKQSTLEVPFEMKNIPMK